MQTKWKITKEFAFCAGHRLYRHGGKCQNVHGHNYKLQVTLEAEELDELGMVTDFSRLKSVIGEWLDSRWDHALLINSKDFALTKITELLPEQKVFFMDENRTAENMAHFLLTDALPRLIDDERIKVQRIKLWETDTSFAEVSA